jgi:hypothetical protein
MNISDYADRKYRLHAHAAHLVTFGAQYAMCGAHEDWWYGTGSMDEIEKAAAMDICKKCEASHAVLYDR